MWNLLGSHRRPSARWPRPKATASCPAQQAGSWRSVSRGCARSTFPWLRLTGGERSLTTLRSRCDPVWASQTVNVGPSGHRPSPRSTNRTQVRLRCARSVAAGPASDQAPSLQTSGPPPRTKGASSGISAPSRLMAAHLLAATFRLQLRRPATDEEDHEGGDCEDSRQLAIPPADDKCPDQAADRANQSGNDSATNPRIAERSATIRRTPHGGKGTGGHDERVGHPKNNSHQCTPESVSQPALLQHGQMRQRRDPTSAHTVGVSPWGR